MGTTNKIRRKSEPGRKTSEAASAKVKNIDGQNDSDGAGHPEDETAPMGKREAARPEAGHELEQALEALSVDHETARRIQKLPRDIGWLLVTAGVVGIVMPGVLGVPFLALGGLMLWPATNRQAERWLAGHSPKIFKGSIRQINRFLDDLERRYPRSPRAR